MSSGGLTTSRIVQAVQDARATHVLLYPFLLYDLLRSSDVTSAMLDSVERILTGGDPVLPWALKAIEQRFPDVELQQAYGLTEGGTMSTLLEHKDRFDHPDSVGRPMPLTQVRTMAEDGNEAQAGQVGEVWVRAPNVAAGYWNNPKATAETFIDGWCRTGDLGRVTEDGFLVLTGRAKDMFRSGGENVYPVEVEKAISTHPAVAAVAVVGVPDTTYIEVGCAFIVLSDTTQQTIKQTTTDLRAHVAEHLAAYKCPKHYMFLDELPVNAAGKIQKNELRARYAASAAQVALKP
jgi:fatty-acyl-CoA synthase